MHILAISESRLHPAARLQPYVHYQSNPPPSGQLLNASLFVHNSFDQVLENMSHPYTDIFVCSVTSWAIFLTIVSVYILPTGQFDATSICTLRQGFPGSLTICGDSTCIILLGALPVLHPVVLHWLLQLTLRNNF